MLGKSELIFLKCDTQAALIKPISYEMDVNYVDEEEKPGDGGKESAGGKHIFSIKIKSMKWKQSENPREVGRGVFRGKGGREEIVKKRGKSAKMLHIFLKFCAIYKQEGGAKENYGCLRIGGAAGAYHVAEFIFFPKKIIFLLNYPEN